MFKHTTEMWTVVIDRWFGEIYPEIACQVGNHLRYIVDILIYINVGIGSPYWRCRVQGVQSAGCTTAPGAHNKGHQKIFG